MATVAWSEFWGPSVGAYTFSAIKNPNRMQIRRALSKDDMVAVVALFQGLIGAATGGTVTATHTRIKPADPFAGGGGSRMLETVTDINRATVAQDVTDLKEIASAITTRPTYPRDLSGNGGPAY